jgi:hypothetical protein
MNQPKHKRGLSPSRRRVSRRSPKTPQTIKKLRGGDETTMFMGQGTWGCVLSPPLSPPPRALADLAPSWIGKITTNEIAKQEFVHYELMRGADPTYRYGVYAAGEPQPVELSKRSTSELAQLGRCSVGDIRLALQQQEQELATRQAKAEAGAGAGAKKTRKRPRASPLPLSLPLPLLSETIMARATEGDMQHIVKQLYAQDKSLMDTPRVLAQTRDHLRACERLVEGLCVYHSAGVVHRDIKPDNAVLADGTFVNPIAYKYIDFGASVDFTAAAKAHSARDKDMPWLFAPFLFRSLATTSVFAKDSTSDEFNIADNVDASIATQEGEVCLPTWITRADQLTAMYEAAGPNLTHAQTHAFFTSVVLPKPKSKSKSKPKPKKTKTAQRPEARALLVATVHNDIYALGIVVGILFSACTGTHLVLDIDGTARGVGGKAAGILGDCAARFVLDVCKGLIWPWNIRERFRNIVMVAEAEASRI